MTDPTFELARVAEEAGRALDEADEHRDPALTAFHEHALAKVAEYSASIPTTWEGALFRLDHSLQMLDPDDDAARLVRQLRCAIARRDPRLAVIARQTAAAYDTVLGYGPGCPPDDNVAAVAAFICSPRRVQ